MKKKEAGIRTSILIEKRHLDFAKDNGIKISKLVRSLLDEVINAVQGNNKKTK